MPDISLGELLESVAADLEATAERGGERIHKPCRDALADLSRALREASFRALRLDEQQRPEQAAANNRAAIGWVMHAISKG